MASALPKQEIIELEEGELEDEVEVENYEDEEFDDYEEFGPPPDYKGMRETFICEVCGDPTMELNSRQTLTSHVNGQRHLTNLDKAITTGTSRWGVKKVETKAPLRKKIPVRLQAKLKTENREPLVGLQFIDEFMPIYDDEMEPYYECFLCSNLGEANAMFNHVISLKHRKNFFDKMFPDLIELSRDELQAMANEYDQSKQLHLVNEYRSDLMFPWSIGKAPWSVEQGGDGEVPRFARENIGSIASAASAGIETQMTWGQVQRNRALVFQNITKPLPKPEHLETIKSTNMAHEYIQFAQGLVDKIEQYERGRVAAGDAKFGQNDETRSKMLQLALKMIESKVPPMGNGVKREQE